MLFSNDIFNITKRVSPGKYALFSKDGKKRLSQPVSAGSMAEANKKLAKRRRQVEFFKGKGKKK